MILDEVNYYKRLFNEKILKKRKMLRRWSKNKKKMKELVENEKTND
jgi:hypothetical protein